MICVDREFVEVLAEAVAEKLFERLKGASPVDNRLLTAKEAAEYLGRTEDAVYQLINRGKIIAVRDGRRVHIERQELMRFIEQRRTA